MTNMENTAQSEPKAPRGKMWLIALLIVVAAGGMYAGTWWKITNYGFLGTGQPLTADNMNGVAQEQPKAATQDTAPTQ